MEEKLFNKGFIAVTSINFIVYLVYYLMMVIIAVIAQEELHASFGQAGVASGIYIIGTLVARLIVGKELELVGRRQIARWGAIFYLVTTIAYLFVPNILVLDTVRLLNGFAYGMTSTALNAIVTDFIPDNRRGEGINYYGLMPHHITTTHLVENVPTVDGQFGSSYWPICWLNVVECDEFSLYCAVVSGINCCRNGGVIYD